MEVISPVRTGRFRHRLARGLSLLTAAREHGAGKVQRLLGRASTLLTQNPVGGNCGIADGLPLNADQMILGYTQGLFPMDEGGKLRWRYPYPRFGLPLDELRVPPELARRLDAGELRVSFDEAPADVLDACRKNADVPWLSERLERLYLELFQLGMMHTVETWRGNELFGGSFGLSVGRVWTSEARFERGAHVGDAQFLHLARHLARRGYTCIECQVYSEALVRFGARDMPSDEYRKHLARGLIAPAIFTEPSTTPVAGL